MSWILAKLMPKSKSGPVCLETPRRNNDRVNYILNAHFSLWKKGANHSAPHWTAVIGARGHRWLPKWTKAWQIANGCFQDEACCKLTQIQDGLKCAQLVAEHL